MELLYLQQIKISILNMNKKETEMEIEKKIQMIYNNSHFLTKKLLKDNFDKLFYKKGLNGLIGTQWFNNLLIYLRKGNQDMKSLSFICNKKEIIEFLIIDYKQDFNAIKISFINKITQKAEVKILTLVNDVYCLDGVPVCIFYKEKEIESKSEEMFQNVYESMEIFDSEDEMDILMSNFKEIRFQ